MNLGLGNLTDLKREILPLAMRADTQFDQSLQTLGSGVAAAFDKHCNRLFLRLVGTTSEFSADRMFYCLPRFPVESISLVERRDTAADGWLTQTTADMIANRSDSAGLIEFGYVLGSYSSRVRVTYTGGYWFDTDENYATTQPAGSVAVPGDLKSAWILQVQHEFERRDSMRKAGIKDAKQESVVGTVQLIDRVKEMLAPYIRFV